MKAIKSIIVLFVLAVGLISMAKPVAVSHFDASRQEGRVRRTMCCCTDAQGNNCCGYVETCPGPIPGCYCP